MERLLMNNGKRIHEMSGLIDGYIHVDKTNQTLCVYGFPNDFERNNVYLDKYNDK